MSNAPAYTPDGIDFTDTSFRLKPSTININQPMTQAEGAEKGKLRLSDGQQFSELTVALLLKPTLQRSYYTGAAGTLNRKPTNLACFSRDMVRPDDSARDKQSVLCADCNKGDLAWERYRQTNAKADIPPCESFYHVVFADVASKQPLQMYIRSKNKKPFEAGIDALKNALRLRKAQGLHYNYFDVQFKLSTLKVPGSLLYWVMTISDIEGIEDEDREAFAALAAQLAPKVAVKSEPTYESKIDRAVEFMGDMELDMDARP